MQIISQTCAIHPGEPVYRRVKRLDVLNGYRPAKDLEEVTCRVCEAETRAVTRKLLRGGSSEPDRGGK